MMRLRSVVLSRSIDADSHNIRQYSVKDGGAVADAVLIDARISKDVVGTAVVDDDGPLRPAVWARSFAVVVVDAVEVVSGVCGDVLDTVAGDDGR